MRTDQFDYSLPKALIANAPLPERDASRLLVLSREDGRPTHRRFTELPSMVRPGDLFIINDTKVIPARLEGRKIPTGGRVEALLVDSLGAGVWRAMVGASGPVRPGMRISFASRRVELVGEVVANEGGGIAHLRFEESFAELLGLLEGGLGQVPLPGYIERGRSKEPPVDDRVRYQTIFADKPGAVAAPTAGLHFTPAILDAIGAAGATVASVTLHVGPGTFMPVRAANVADHRMHSERYEIPAATAGAVRTAREEGRRVVAVGTTVLRALEASAAGPEGVRPGAGETNLFIRPGYRFKTVDCLLTNFHLPRSTLLMLVCAFAGRQRVLAAYEEAVEKGYRFYSYGDAMLLL